MAGRPREEHFWVEVEERFSDPMVTRVLQSVRITTPRYRSLQEQYTDAIIGISDNSIIDDLKTKSFIRFMVRERVESDVPAVGTNTLHFQLWVLPTKYTRIQESRMLSFATYVVHSFKTMLGVQGAEEAAKEFTERAVRKYCGGYFRSIVRENPFQE